MAIGDLTGSGLTTYPLENNGGGDLDALGLKLYNRAIEAFQAKTLFYSTFRGRLFPVRDMTGQGITDQWILDGRASAPGQTADGLFLDPSEVLQLEKTITQEAPYKTALALNQEDVDRTHWPMISGKVAAKVQAVAEKMDSNLIALSINAARSAAVSNIHDGGNRVIAAENGASVAAVYEPSTTGVSRLRRDLLALAEDMDDKYQAEQRVAIVRPDVFTCMQYDPDGFDINLSRNSGDYNGRMVARYAGFDILKCTRFPITNVTSGDTRYRGNFSGTQSASEDYGFPAVLAFNTANEGKPALAGISHGGGLKQFYENMVADRGVHYWSWRLQEAYGIVNPSSAGVIEVQAA